MKLKQIIFFLFFVSSLVLYAEETVKSVSVKEAQVRSKPSFLGNILYVLKYGDSVTVYQINGGWSKVGSYLSSELGWMHTSALTEKKLVLSTSSTGIDSGASNSEVALAGKGFNKEVEANYKSQNNIDYSLIDQMEQFVVTDEELINFIREGNLILGGLE